MACASCSGVSLASNSFFFSSSSLFFLRMSSTRPAFSSNSIISLSVLYSSGSKLNLIDPLNRVGSWGMIVIASLTCYKLILPISTPSISILPPQSSIILVKARVMVLLPAPVLPTTPIFSPPLISIESSLRTFSVVGLYLSSTSENLIAPLLGQAFSV